MVEIRVNLKVKILNNLQTFLSWWLRVGIIFKFNFKVVILVFSRTHLMNTYLLSVQLVACVTFKYPILANARNM